MLETSSEKYLPVLLRCFTENGIESIHILRYHYGPSIIRAIERCKYNETLSAERIFERAIDNFSRYPSRQNFHTGNKALHFFLEFITNILTGDLLGEPFKFLQEQSRVSKKLKEEFNDIYSQRMVKASICYECRDAASTLFNVEGFKNEATEVKELLYETFWGHLVLYCYEQVAVISLAIVTTNRVFTELYLQKHKFDSLVMIREFLFSSAQEQCRSHTKK